MARNKTLYLYNDAERAQEWAVDSDGFIRESYTVEQARKSFTIGLSRNATIEFGVGDAAYLTATHAYITGSWTSHADTSNEINCVAPQSAVNVTSSCTPE